jgi:NTP pyrophosphatase (non-canonical NTP hydrolase)
MHKYGEGISFYYITKKEFDELLDLVKQLSPEEYKDEAKDDFYQLVAYWNEAGRDRLEHQIISLKRRVELKQ